MVGASRAVPEWVRNAHLVRVQIAFRTSLAGRVPGALAHMMYDAFEEFVRMPEIARHLHHHHGDEKQRGLGHHKMCGKPLAIASSSGHVRVWQGCLLRIGHNCISAPQELFKKEKVGVVLAAPLFVALGEHGRKCQKRPQRGTSAVALCGVE